MRRRIDISPHEILHFRHFRLHETHFFVSRTCAQGVVVGVGCMK